MLANKPYLRQADVQKILDAANAHAEKYNWAVTIAVCDDGGHLLGLIRRDGCAPVSSYIAQDKARSSAMGKRESKVYEDIINNSDESLIINNNNDLFSGITSSKVSYMKKLWSSSSFTQEHKEELWKWFKIFLKLAKLYNSSL